jgi:cytochrome c oxidase subunit 2
MDRFKFFPAAATSYATNVDTLTIYLLFWSGLVVIGVFAVMGWFCIKYRAGSSADRTNPPRGNTAVETFWSVTPFIIFLSFYVWGSMLYLRFEAPPPTTLDVYVIGKQWMWKLQHLEGKGEINELHVPLGMPVRLIMTSQDVIHDFYVPEFRVHEDVLPGRYTMEWFTPTQIGEFHMFCSQYCGAFHSRMVGHVVVMQPAEYQRWLTEPLPYVPALSDAQFSNKRPQVMASPAAPAPVPTGSPYLLTNVTMASQGEELYRRMGCISCHGNPSQAPPLEGLFGTTVQLEGGGSVVADENYIRESIVNPRAKIVRGYSGIMPSFEGQLSAEQISDIIEFIKSMGTTPAAAPQTKGEQVAP